MHHDTQLYIVYSILYFQPLKATKMSMRQYVPTLRPDSPSVLESLNNTVA